MIFYTARAARLECCQQVVYFLVIDLDAAGNHLSANLHDSELLAHILTKLSITVAVTLQDIPELCQADAVFFGQALYFVV